MNATESKTQEQAITSQKSFAVPVADGDYEVRSLHLQEGTDTLRKPWWHNVQYLAVGVLFGIVFVKAEITSWFRMQEMFRLQNIHMFGVMGTALVVGMLSVWIIKRFQVKTIRGEPVRFQSKKFNRGQVFGGLLFGAGWAMTGACPGTLFAQIGGGAMVVSVVLVSAVAGTWVYGAVRSRLPH